MSDDTKPLSYGSLRYERDLREHGAAVTTRPWWNAPGEDSRACDLDSIEKDVAAMQANLSLVGLVFQRA